MSTTSLLPVYRRSGIVIERGEGVYLYAPDGTRYLDFASGIAVNALGHSHPHLVAALRDQAAKLWHVSNMYSTPGLLRFADRLVAATFADKIFFCNSGSEAVECGIKMIRKYFSSPSRGEGKNRIITFEGGFHGRTLACISAGGNEIAREGYAPLLDGFDRVPFGDLAAVERAITPHTAGILVEAIQGEGGVRVASVEFLQGLRKLADKHGLLLMLDEVQAGMGRTGKLFAFEHAGIVPDIVTVAKGIGNGFPLAACLAGDKVAAAMSPGTHGSTYGANPLAMAVGNAVLDIMLAEGFFAQVEKMGAALESGLRELQRRFPAVIAEVRGRGLLLGIRMAIPHHAFVEALREEKLLTSPAQDNVIRIIPPLVVNSGHISDALAILARICEKVP
ncbi:MAG: aspartate aminotransferase family protein [Alphaproteobacteria bacterium]|nr:aspartate aminotransferase family protein [Alphaproteobacteria bacterium]